MAYISRVKAKGDYYFYVYGYDPIKQNNKPFYSLGKQKKAIENLRKWIDNTEDVPSLLKEKGIVIEDLKKWVKKLKTA